MTEPLKKGVVAVLDALGFKGIWGREDARAVVSRLQSAQSFESNFSLHGFDVQIQFLSDTVVVACGFGQGDPWHPLLYVCMRLGYFLSNMLTREGPCLAYRGAVASGEYLLEDNFIIGPAVDEAAEREKQAQGPFVWLTPSARGLLPPGFEASRERVTEGSFYVMPFRVPLKGGRMEDTYVVPPTIAVTGLKDITTRLRYVLRGAPREKVENTERLLEALEDWYPRDPNP